MEIRKINADYSVGPQISADDIAELKAAGFQSVMVNRPDREADDQPEYAIIADGAKAAGLEIAYSPAVSGQITDENVSDYSEKYAALPKPLFAYCRTGTRSTMLWALMQGYAGKSYEEILKVAQEAGYDISPLEHRIKATV